MRIAPITRSLLNAHRRRAEFGMRKESRTIDLYEKSSIPAISDSLNPSLPSLAEKTGIVCVDILA